MDKIIITVNEAKKDSNKELLSKLASSNHGLSSKEATIRFQEYGPNEITEKKTKPIIKFFRYFWGPIPWLIEIAIIISALIQHWADLGIISTLLLLNAVIGFWQEYKAR